MVGSLRGKSLAELEQSCPSCQDLSAWPQARLFVCLLVSRACVCAGREVTQTFHAHVCLPLAAQVRALFAVANCFASSVIFIDEIDSLLSARKTEGVPAYMSVLFSNTTSSGYCLSISKRGWVIYGLPQTAIT